jgi:hypothetical protein
LERSLTTPDDTAALLSLLDTEALHYEHSNHRGGSLGVASSALPNSGRHHRTNSQSHGHGHGHGHGYHERHRSQSVLSSQSLSPLPGDHPVPPSSNSGNNTNRSNHGGGSGGGGGGGSGHHRTKSGHHHRSSSRVPPGASTAASLAEAVDVSLIVSPVGSPPSVTHRRRLTNGDASNDGSVAIARAVQQMEHFPVNDDMTPGGSVRTPSTNDAIDSRHLLHLDSDQILAASRAAVSTPSHHASRPPPAAVATTNTETKDVLPPSVNKSLSMSGTLWPRRDKEEKQRRATDHYNHRQPYYHNNDNGNDDDHNQNDDEDDDDEPNGNGRSQSPVIIWRPTARVKVVTDVPPELRSVFLKDTGHANDDPLHVSIYLLSSLSIHNDLLICYACHLIAS